MGLGLRYPRTGKEVRGCGGASTGVGPGWGGLPNTFSRGRPAPARRGSHVRGQRALRSRRHARERRRRAAEQQGEARAMLRHAGQNRFGGQVRRARRRAALVARWHPGRAWARDASTRWRPGFPPPVRAVADGDGLLAAGGRLLHAARVTAAFAFWQGEGGQRRGRCSRGKRQDDRRAGGGCRRGRGQREAGRGPRAPKGERWRGAAQPAAALDARRLSAASQTSRATHHSSTHHNGNHPPAPAFIILIIFILVSFINAPTLYM